MTPRCLILMYHVVDEPRRADERRLCCPPAAFAAQMACLKDGGWNVVSLSDFVAAAATGTPLAERSVVITFDDGTACTHEHALPVLRRFGFPATVFMVSGLIGGRNEWMVRAGRPERRMLGVEQLRELVRDGVEVGSHTVHHVRLAGLERGRLQDELRRSRQQLEDALGRPVAHFAFPHGSHDAAAVAAVRAAGYASACTTQPGLNGLGQDPFTLRRTEVMGGDTLLQFRLKLRVGSHDMPPWSLARAAARRLLVRAGWRPSRRPPAPTTEARESHSAASDSPGDRKWN